MRPAGQSIPSPSTPDSLGAVAAETVRQRPLAWLWPGRFALGKLGLLLGDPDTGKSLVTVDIAARVSRGAAWPDGTLAPRGRVLLLSAEDDPGDTIHPRLEAAGADMTRIHILDTCDFNLRRDIGRLAAWLLGHADRRLVIIDPLAAFMRETTNAAMRGILDPLAFLAARTGTAVLGVVHLNKKDGGKALYRASGALAAIAAARHVYLVGRDAADPQRRLMARIKNNLATSDSGAAFHIEAAANGQPMVAWEPNACGVRAEDLLAAAEADPETRREADEWLASALAKGRCAARELRRLAQSEGIPWRTVNRAKARLGILAARDGFGTGSAWHWQLPNKPDPAAPG